MKLLDYLKLNDISDEAFAAEFNGEISASGVRKWKYGERNPRLPELVRIEEITNGAVTTRDFLSEQPASTPSQDPASPPFTEAAP